MSVKRYGVKTASGSWYYVEDHTHLFKKPTWKIFSKGEEYYIIGLLLVGSDKEPIEIGKLDSIKQFIGYQVFFDRDQYTRLTIHTKGNTSSVVEVIEFK